MSFERIVGQKHAKTLVEAWLKERRVPHAILLSGPSGTGKRCLALELAKAVNCQEAAGQACDRCVSCRKIESLIHPDVHMLLPLTSRREKQDSAQLQENTRTAVLDYIQQGGSLSRSNVNIARESLRELQREMAYAPTEAPYRVGLIFEAECMHSAGANSLLKILEEPPKKAIFILVSANPERILPTVLSRCQRVPLQHLSQAELKVHLQGLGLSGERLELAARMGGGSLDRAKQVAAGAFDEIRERVEQFLQAGIEAEDESYWELLDEVGARADRGQLEAFLEVCGLYLRDLLLLAYGRENRIVGVDRLDFLHRVQPFFQVPQIEAAAIEVDRAFEYLSRNVNTNLVLVDLWRCLQASGNPEKEVRR